MKKNVVMTVAAGRPLHEVLQLCLAARRSPMLMGGTGVGKSAILQAYAQKHKIGFISRDLSLMEPPDLVGMPKLDGDRTRFLSPAFLPREGKGLFVLEEINRAPEYMRAPCLMLLTDRSLNDYRLPEGWLPVAAINPAEDGYEAAELDPAMLSRFVLINVVPDRDEWLFWARENHVHSLVLAYVASDLSVFDSPLSNPRSWTYVSDLLHADDTLKTDSSLLRAAVAGCVGIERATAFMRFCKGSVLPLGAKQIFSSYASCRKSVLDWVKEGKLDLVDSTLLNVEKQLQSSGEFHATQADAKAWKNLGRFLADLPGDLRTRAEQFFQEHKYRLPPKPRRAA